MKLKLIQKDRNNAGDITRILVRVANEANESIDYNLTEPEMADYLADETTLTPILEKMGAELALRLEEEALTKPQPTIYETPEKLETFEIKADKVATKLSALRVEKAEALEAQNLDPDGEPK